MKTQKTQETQTHEVVNIPHFATCKWGKTENGMDRYWKTECGNEYILMEPDEDLKYQGYNFCPNCGKQIVESV